MPVASQNVAHVYVNAFIRYKESLKNIQNKDLNKRY